MQPYWWYASLIEWACNLTFDVSVQKFGWFISCVEGYWSSDSKPVLPTLSLIIHYFVAEVNVVIITLIGGKGFTVWDATEDSWMVSRIERCFIIRRWSSWDRRRGREHCATLLSIITTWPDIYFIFVCHQLSLRLVLSLLCDVDSFHLISLLMIITMTGHDYHKVSLLYRAFLLYKNRLPTHSTKGSFLLTRL